jgi:NADH-quinone oxidoreductase E subunit
LSQVLNPGEREALVQMAARYPRRRSVVIPALWAVQRKVGHIPYEAEEEVAAIAGMTAAQVREIVTFYSMFRQQPGGRYLISVCGTIACALCGAEGLVDYLKEKLGIAAGETTDDGLFTLEVVECLGACSWAPVMLINDRLHVRLKRAKVDEILETLRADAGSQ